MREEGGIDDEDVCVIGQDERAFLEEERGDSMSELQLSQDSSRKHLVLPSISARTTELDTV